MRCRYDEKWKGKCAWDKSSGVYAGKVYAPYGSTAKRLLLHFLKTAKNFLMLPACKTVGGFFIPIYRKTQKNKAYPE
jgi:hypothetical protein